MQFENGWVTCRCLLTIISEVVTILGFVYAFFWISNYKTQKKIDNQIAEARRALDELLSISEELEILFYGRDKDRYRALKTLPFLLKKLKYTLLLLDDRGEITNMFSLMEELEKTLLIKEISPQKATDAVKDILKYGTYADNLEKLKASLLKIYKLKN